MGAPNFEIIKNGLGKKTTEELLKIWKENDCFSWTDDAFLAVKDLLTERNIELPEQDPAPEEAKPKQINTDAKYGIACILGGIVVFLVSINLGSTLILPSGLIGVGLLILSKDHIY